MFFPKNFNRLLLSFLLSGMLFSCAPTRPSVTPGEIPDAVSGTARDRQAGEQVKASLLEKFPEERNPEIVGGVRRIFDRLLLARDIRDPWELVVLRDDSVANAAATRGPVVFIWTGMIRELGSDELIAAVLAHEIAHVLSGHVIPDPAETVNRLLVQVAGMAAGSVMPHK
jgi:predicted Zn-dependent protease